jgi:hypothetical protein
MSKSTFKKFKKNDYYEDEDDTYYDNPRNRVNKKESKRIERALKTKDIDALVEEEDNYDYDDREFYHDPGTEK